MQKYYNVVIDLKVVFQQLRKNILLLSIGGVVGAVFAFAFAWFFVTPIYQSSTSFYVNNKNNQNNTDSQYYSQTDLNAAQSLVNTYIVILNQYPTLEAVIQNCNLPYNDVQLKSMISAKAENNTEIFTVTVTATEPYEAQMIANSIANILPLQIAVVVEGASVRVVANGKLNLNQVAPSYQKYALNGFLIGLVLMIIFVLVRYYSDKRIHDENFVKDVPGDNPVLAVIPNLLEDQEKKGYGYAKYGSTDNSNLRSIATDEERLLCENLSFNAVEAYKLLRTNVLYALTDKKSCTVIGVTSSVRGEAKSTTAINLAFFLSEMRKRVLLIEGDMRLPVIAKRLHLDEKSGLSNILGEFCGIKDAIQCPKPRKNWFVVTGGDIPPNPSELLGSKQMKKMLEVCRNNFDHIIIDLPPVNVVSDALVVSRYLDGMVMIVREEYTEMPAFLDALQKIMFSQINLLGFVLTDSNVTRKNKYGNYKYESGNSQGYEYGKKTNNTKQNEECLLHAVSHPVNKGNSHSASRS